MTDRDFSDPSITSLHDIYARLEHHYSGKHVLHPGHLEHLLDAMRRLEEHVDALADMHRDLLRNASWLGQAQQANSPSHPKRNECSGT